MKIKLGDKSLFLYIGKDGSKFEVHCRDLLIDRKYIARLNKKYQCLLIINTYSNIPSGWEFDGRYFIMNASSKGYFSAYNALSIKYISDEN